MLRLLAQREEGYEDIAALLGIGVEEVRERVAEALAEVDAEEEAAADVPAAPEAPAPVPAPPAPEREPEPPAPEPSPPPAAAPAGAPRSPRTPRLKLPKDRGALIGLGAGALAVLALVVVLLVSGDGGSGTSEASNGATAAAENSNLTQAILSPTDGSDASGRALFGRYKKNVLLQVEAEGLQSSPPGQSYTIWLYRSPKLVLRMGSVNVRPKDDGKIAVQLPIPTQVLGYVASGAFDQIDISLTSNAAYKAELASAKKANRLPKFTGESILRGKITGPAIG